MTERERLAFVKHMICCELDKTVPIPDDLLIRVITKPDRFGERYRVLIGAGAEGQARVLTSSQTERKDV